MRTHTTSPVSHQTVRLSRGRHRTPSEGVCVMELASMLAGERFSDRPRSVCPVVGAFLRTYNDLIGDDRRQDLYGYAAEAVGTRGDRALRRARADLCERFVEHCQATAPPSRLAGICPGPWRAEEAGRRAAMAAVVSRQPTGHSMALALLDALLACGAGDGEGARAPAEPPASEPAGSRREPVASG